MAFDIKPEDLGIGEKKKEILKKEESLDVRNYTKNLLGTIKDVKTAMTETLDILGLSKEDLRNKVKGMMRNSQPQQTQQMPSNYVPLSQREKKKVIPAKVQEVETKKKEKMDFEKLMKKVKLVVKFMKAEDMKVSEFIALIEENKGDLKDILE